MRSRLARIAWRSVVASLLLAGPALLPALAPDAAAVTATTTFQTRTVIVAECTLDATSTLLDFGTRSFLSGDTDAQTAFTLQCTNETPYQIGIDDGNNGFGNETHRLLGGITGYFIPYYLYQDSGHVTYWSEQPGELKFGTGNGGTETHYIYGRIFTTTGQKPDVYSDTNMITVTY
jgi:spore coat protein U-like protein